MINMFYIGLFGCSQAVCVWHIFLVLTVGFSYGQIMVTMNLTTEFDGVLVENQPWTLSCTYKLSSGRTFQQMVLRGGGVNVYNIKGVTSPITSSRISITTSATTVSGKTVLVHFDTFNVTIDRAVWLCSIRDDQTTISGSLDLSGIAYNSPPPPSPQDISITISCIGNNIRATSPAVPTAHNAIPQQIYFYNGEGSLVDCYMNTVVNSARICTIKQSFVPSSANYTVVATLFGVTSGAMAVAQDCRQGSTQTYLPGNLHLVTFSRITMPILRGNIQTFSLIVTVTAQLFVLCLHIYYL